MNTKNDTTIRKGGSFLVEATRPADVFTPEDFSDEQKMFVKTAEDFVNNEVLPNMEKTEAKEEGAMVGLLKKAGELGLLMIDIPEAYGGLGLDRATSMAVIEAISRGGAFATTSASAASNDVHTQSFDGNEWTLSWRDEFNAGYIDTGIWNFETGNNNGWGNNELQYYRSNNAWTENSHLVIEARDMTTQQAESLVERQARAYEQAKPGFVERWPSAATSSLKSCGCVAAFRASSMEMTPSW